MPILKTISEFFTVFLVLLQFLAPMIHAHSNSAEEFVSIWHVPEFEQINYVSLNKSKLTPIDNYGTDVIVTVSAGVKNKVKNFCENGNSHFVLLYLLLLNLVYCRHRFFQPNYQRIFVFKKHFSHSVRAPPL